MSSRSEAGAETLLIRGGEVVDPAGRRRADVGIRDGRIVAVGENLDIEGVDRVIDADGCIVSTGFVDLHSHLREPGQEEAETIQSGSRGAALGGYTTVLAMPNTIPAIDSASIVRDVMQLAETALCDVLPVGAITKGRAGSELAPMAEMAALGVTIFTDDGAGVADNTLMRRAMEYATGLDVTLAQHCEDPALSQGGSMHEGEWSSRLGIPAQPAEAEELMVMRDIALCQAHRKRQGALPAPLHPTAPIEPWSVPPRRWRPPQSPCEATTHHFTLTHARMQLQSYDPVFKVNPPLRTDDRRRSR